MKKIFALTLLAGTFVFANEAKAQYSLPGSFSSQDNNNGTYTLRCTGTQSQCGVLGRQTADGGRIFVDSYGGRWVVYTTYQDQGPAPSQPIPAPTPLQTEFANGILAVEEN